MDNRSRGRALVPTRDATPNALVPAPALTEDEQARLARAFKAKHSPRTRSEYTRAWIRFAEWCGPKGHTPLPAHPATIALYFTEKAEEGKSISYLRLAHAAIRHVHAGSFPEVMPPTEVPMVTDVLTGLRNTYGRPKNKKKGATADLILQMLATLGSGSWEDIRSRCIILLGFSSAMRRSELVNIRMRDLERVSNGYVIMIPKSKGDQSGAGQQVGLARNAAFTQLCPVRAIEAWIALAKPRDFLLCHEEGSPITASVVVRAIKTAAEAAGLDPTKFSGHSLRRGHITQAKRDGKSRDVIRRQSRHKQDATLDEYLEQDEIETNNSSVGLGSSLLKR